MSEWQPIETAPEGQQVLVCVFDRISVAIKHVSWRCMADNDQVYDNDDPVLIQPTHWMPLPEPPSAA